MASEIYNGQGQVDAISFCRFSIQMANTATVRRLCHQNLASDCDLMPLLCDFSKLPSSKMATRHDTNAGRNIRPDSPSPPSLRRANKIIQVRIHHRPHGLCVTLLAGQLGKSPRKGAKKGWRQKRAISEREAARLDWMR